MCHVLLLFMGNAIFGAGDRKTTESARSGATDPKTAGAAMNELARDVERLKAAMDEKDRTIERLARSVDDIRVSPPGRAQRDIALYIVHDVRTPSDVPVKFVGSMFAKIREHKKNEGLPY